MKSTSIIKQFNKLTYVEQTELLQRLKVTLSESRPILNHIKSIKECPYCKGMRVYKHGVYKNGGTRFRCQECKKSYNELTGTSIHCIKKKDLWDSFIGLMLESRSIRYISVELGISTKTVFEWRHKVLSSFDNLYKKEFKGIVETDSIYFRFSQKGRKNNFVKGGLRKRGVSSQQVNVLLTMDRYKTYDFKVVKLGKLDIKSIERVIDRSRYNKENIICSDSEWSLVSVYKDMELEHKTFKSGLGVHNVDGVYHVNNLNNMVSRTKGWIRGNFRSVSTKYLGHYLSWFTMLEVLKKRGNKNDKMWDYILMDRSSFERNKKIEEEYQNFLSY